MSSAPCLLLLQKSAAECQGFKGLEGLRVKEGRVEKGEIQEAEKEEGRRGEREYLLYATTKE